MTCGIYCIRNVKNGKSYVGSAVNINSRWYVHRRSLKANKHHSILLQRSWNKHGEAVFTFEVIEECERSDLSRREQFWIDNLMAATPELGYNISPSAGGSNLGRKLTIEQRAKISAGLIGKFVGKKMSPEVCAKMSRLRRGKPCPGHKGRAKSAEQRAKISATLSGRKHSKEDVEKRRAGWKARFGNETPEYLFRAARASAATPEKIAARMAKGLETKRLKREAREAAAELLKPPPTERYLKWSAAVADKRAGWSEKAKARNAAMTPEERRARALKGAATRAANRAPIPTVIAAAVM